MQEFIDRKDIIMIAHGLNDDKIPVRQNTNGLNET